MTLENVRNARKTECDVLDALETDNSSSGGVMFTIAEHVATINGGECLDCTDESSSCTYSDDILNPTAMTSIYSWETQSSYSKP